MKDMNEQSLSLSGLDLSLPVSTKDLMLKCIEEQKEYQKKYGDDWSSYYNRDNYSLSCVDYDLTMKAVNTGIYRRKRAIRSGSPEALIRYNKLQRERVSELFHRDCPVWNMPFLFDMEQSVIGEILIQDAIKTGKWKELPDELQDEYHKRVKL